MSDIPQVLKDALYSPQTIGALKVIGEKNKLHLDILGELEAFVNLRIMGAIGDTDFIKGVRGVITETKIADTVLTDINTTIFVPLRSKLNASIETVKIKKVVDDVPPAVRSGPLPAARLSGAQPKEVRKIDVTMPSRRLPAQGLLEEPKVPAVVDAAPKVAVVASDAKAVGAAFSETFPPRPEVGESVAPTAAPSAVPPKPREEIPILKQNVTALSTSMTPKAAPSTRAPELIKTGGQYTDIDPYHEPI